MTKEKNDGGPAFAAHAISGMDGSACIQEGMSLRDYMAGQQLIAFRAHPANERIGHLDSVAEYCYAMADAMIRARDLNA